ncbi:MAG: 6-carboxytetrahydropterin synthase [Deltaproteobacteria bacterium]|nr:6-carboxytetrahydropterin synthase [Deltaproteobacteria bacterium]MCL5276327.1 6-carboxytetrahydropterin synthase [Deltaproteobacteria bacterium]
MYEIGITRRFSSAHRLAHYNGKCEGLHGHNYKVEIVAYGSTLVDGMLIDFALFRQKVDEIIQAMDHVYLNEMGPFKESEPSAENIAEYIHTTISNRLGDAVHLKYVKVWESDDNWALYRTGE